MKRGRMKRGRWMRALVATLVVALEWGAWMSPALAHEHRTVGAVRMTVGWVDEPTYSGLKNAVQLFLADASKKPITGASDTLKVQVLFGNQKTAPLTLEESGRRPGEYEAAIIPTRPGTYTFHFVGSINGQQIDQSFTSSETTFDPVVDTSAIEFPAKDPSIAEVAELVTRVAARTDAASAATAAAASRATVFGIAGIVVGLVGIAVGMTARKSPGK